MAKRLEKFSKRRGGLVTDSSKNCKEKPKKRKRKSQNLTSEN